MNTLSYHGRQEIKDWHVKQARTHREQENLAKGTYGIHMHGMFKGCSVGCFAHDLRNKENSEYVDRHTLVANEAGWPVWLVYWSDSIFEFLPIGENEDFHVQLRELVPVGVDLNPLEHELAIVRLNVLLSNLDICVCRNQDDLKLVREVVSATVGYHRDALTGRATEEDRAAARSNTYHALKKISLDGGYNEQSALQHAVKSAACSVGPTDIYRGVGNSLYDACTALDYMVGFQKIRRSESRIYATHEMSRLEKRTLFAELARMSARTTLEA